jgi:sulfite reductase (NADPH) flavoprotein alpha-component
MLMNTLPKLPTNAPFTAEQRAWIDGFLAGVFNELLASTTSTQEKSATAEKKPLLLLFGSQSGSAEGLAKKFAKQAESKGYQTRVLALNEYAKVDWARESRCLVITSTWGEGDPPDNATAAWAWLNSEAAPRLEHLHYAVLGLGDRNYSEFCGAAKKFDLRFEALGAKRLVPRGECDVDYETIAKAWLETVWEALNASREITQGAALLQVVADAEEKPTSTSYNRTNPFPAQLKTNRRLNGASSAKDTRHFEILLGENGPAYEPGDALGVVPENCPVLVEQLLAALHFDGDEMVQDAHGKESNLHTALLKTFNIIQPQSSLLEAAAERAKNSALLDLLAPAQKAALDKWLYGRDIVDVLGSCSGAKFTPVEFTNLLRKLQPRLYSISSSPKAHPGEVHLTVAAVRYECQGRERKGVASCWLADRVALNETIVPVFIQTSHGFRLPADTSRPVIMVGPGTGIAPFRAFLEERRAVAARGKNWLFFGDQQRGCDFLYEEELTAMVKDGCLNRLDLAFSRDQAEKIYVQNRMLENAAELWTWLEGGAHFYVCGDAKRMAKDVDAALHQVVVQAGGKTMEQASEYVAKLKTDKRYQRDVY